MKKKRVLALLLSFTMISSTLSVSAANSVAGTEPGAAITENTTSQSMVHAEIDGSFSVTIPKTITLSGESKTGAYTVSVEADLGGKEFVSVVPDATFSLTSQGKADVTASVEQDKTEWKYSDSGTNASGSISASGITAGTWEGTLNFNIALH